MKNETCKLPELEVLKELLKDQNNVIWYMRQQDLEGSPESVKYAKKKINEFIEIKNKKQLD